MYRVQFDFSIDRLSCEDIFFLKMHLNIHQAYFEISNIIATDTRADRCLILNNRALPVIKWNTKIAACTSRWRENDVFDVSCHTNNTKPGGRWNKRIQIPNMESDGWWFAEWWNTCQARERRKKTSKSSTSAMNEYFDIQCKTGNEYCNTHRRTINGCRRPLITQRSLLWP